MICIILYLDLSEIFVTESLIIISVANQKLSCF